MVGAIWLAGGEHVSALRRRFAAGAFLLGAVTSAALLGGALAAAGEAAAQRDVRFVLELFTAIAVLWVAARLAGMAPYLAPRRQVQSRWAGSYGRVRGAAGWGVQLGLGFATRVDWAPTVLMVPAALLLGLPLGLFVWIVYGFTRGVQVLLTSYLPQVHQAVLHSTAERPLGWIFVVAGPVVLAAVAR